jgi:hypothetical protein
LGALDGQLDPLVRDLAEGLEGGHQGGDLEERFGPDEAAGELAVVGVGEFGVGTVRLGFFGVGTLAARFTADLVLAGEAARVEGTQVQELAFEVEDFFINGLQGTVFLHIRYHIFNT